MVLQTIYSNPNLNIKNSFVCATSPAVTRCCLEKWCNGWPSATKYYVWLRRKRALGPTKRKILRNMSDILAYSFPIDKLTSHFNHTGLEVFLLNKLTYYQEIT